MVKAAGARGHAALEMLQAALALEHLHRESLHVPPDGSPSPVPLDHAVRQQLDDELAEAVHGGKRSSADAGTLRTPGLRKASGFALLDCASSEGVRPRSAWP